MVSHARLLQRLRYSLQRQFQDTPVRSARARATIRRSRPWEAGRIGNIEKLISQTMIFAERDKLFTTGELARAIYANPVWDQNCNLRKRGEKLPKLKSWRYLAIRKACSNVCRLHGSVKCQRSSLAMAPSSRSIF